MATINTAMKTIAVIRGFQITVLRVGSAVDVNCFVICMEKGTEVHKSLRGKNLGTKYGLPEGYFVLQSKEAYMDDKTWAKVVKVVASGIREMAVSNVAFVFSILFSTYLTLHIRSSKFSLNDS